MNYHEFVNISSRFCDMISPNMSIYLCSRFCRAGRGTYSIYRHTSTFLQKELRCNWWGLFAHVFLKTTPSLIKSFCTHWEQNKPHQFYAAFSFHGPLGQLFRMSFMPNTHLLCSPTSSTEAPEQPHTALCLCWARASWASSSLLETTHIRNVKRNRKALLQLRTNQKPLLPELTLAALTFIYSVLIVAMLEWHGIEYFPASDTKKAFSIVLKQPRNLPTSWQSTVYKLWRKGEKTAPS